MPGNVNRMIKEDLERTIFVMRDGKRKQRTKKLDFRLNPEKLKIGQIGEFEFFCYPYSSNGGIQVRIKHSISTFEVVDLERFLSRILSRTKRIKLYSARGVLRENRFGKKYQKAYDAGIKAIFKPESAKGA